MSLEYKINDTILFINLFTLASLKVPSGYLLALMYRVTASATLSTQAMLAWKSPPRPGLSPRSALRASMHLARFWLLYQGLCKRGKSFK